MPAVLGLNGNAITMRPNLAKRICPEDRLGDPDAVGAALREVVAELAARDKVLRFGVVHRYSSHNYILRYWLAACGILPDRDVEIVTIPPPSCADALQTCEVDAICVGEPWNSIAVERGAGQIVLATAQIWQRGLEKVLALRETVLDEKREAVVLLIRAICRAGRHFVDPANWDVNAKILARREYLDGDPALIKRAISGRLFLARGGEIFHYPDFMFQYREAATFPWVSQAEWLYTQMVRWDGTALNDADAQKLPEFFARTYTAVH